MDHQKAITVVLNTIYEVSNIEKSASSEGIKEKLINYKAESLLKKLHGLREEEKEDVKEK